MIHRFAMLTMIAALMAASPALRAQTTRVPEQLRPVDQAVEDLDPLSRSHRVIHNGISLLGDETQMYVLDPPAGSNAAPVYYRIGRGFRARMNRMHYMVRMKWPFDLFYTMHQSPRVPGEFWEVAPLDTVWELDPKWEPPDLSPPEPRPNPYRRDGQIDGRISGQVHGAIDGRVQATPGPTDDQLTPAGLAEEAAMKMAIRNRRQAEDAAANAEEAGPVERDRDTRPMLESISRFHDPMQPEGGDPVVRMRQLSGSDASRP